MKKLILLVILVLGTGIANAQIGKGNVLIGGDLGNLNINFSNQTSFQITPRAAWFIEDGLAVGAYGQFGFNHINGQDGNTYTYGVGPLARYFVNLKELPSLGQAKFFVEGSAGFEGANNTVNNSHTNGLGFGFGPGISYFITPSVAVEALLKYNGIVGFGSTTYTNGLSLGIGFQVYLPSKKVVKEIKSL